eukprot:1395765-Pyramimonas_sp.AAC.1
MVGVRRGPKAAVGLCKEICAGPRTGRTSQDTPARGRRGRARARARAGGRARARVQKGGRHH